MNGEHLLLPFLPELLHLFKLVHNSLIVCPIISASVAMNLSDDHAYVPGTAGALKARWARRIGPHPFQRSRLPSKVSMLTSCTTSSAAMNFPVILAPFVLGLSTHSLVLCDIAPQLKEGRMQGNLRAGIKSTLQQAPDRQDKVLTFRKHPF